jgi:hypothetical protein
MSGRRFAFFGTLAALAAFSAVFLWRQNVGGQIGGAISPPKLLWLDYTLLSWFILPAFFLTAEGLPRWLRRAFTGHLINFGVRGIVELWLLYVSVAWTPLYGIAHGVFSQILLRALARRRTDEPEAVASAAAHHFMAIRLTLVAELMFASLFYLQTRGEGAIYFASSTPRFFQINALTTAVVCVAYADLFVVFRRGREVFLGAATVKVSRYLPKAF